MKDFFGFVLEKRYMNIRIRKISKILAPGYGCCGKCNTTWKFVEPHLTNYKENEGMFPLCEKCWNTLTPHQRLPYYINLYNRWNRDDETELELIKKAVLEEK